MKRREVLSRIFGLSGTVGVASIISPSRSSSVLVEPQQKKKPHLTCPVCGEGCGLFKTTLAEATTIFDVDRKYTPLADMYFHQGGKRCSVMTNKVIPTSSGPIHETARWDNAEKKWKRAGSSIFIVRSQRT